MKKPVWKQVEILTPSVKNNKMVKFRESAHRVTLTGLISRIHPQFKIKSQLNQLRKLYRVAPLVSKYLLGTARFRVLQYSINLSNWATESGD